MDFKNRRWRRMGLPALLLVLCLSLTACGDFGEELSEEFSAAVESELESVFSGYEAQDISFDLEDVPEFAGEPFVVLNDNMPEFTEKQKITDSFEKYGPLDRLGRCSAALANVGQDLMPTEERGSIGMVKPTGWHLVKYDIVSGKYLYNRCHLIGFQLTGENANEQNLITGTRYLNVEGMLPFEEVVAQYVKETGNHVLYRVTPIYKGEERIARGVQMEGWSVEDNGKEICFNVYSYNNQPGIEIDYATGESRLSEDVGAAKDAPGVEQGEIRGNKRSKVYHCPGQNAYEEMKDSRNLIVFETEEEAQAAGYRRAQQ